MKKLYFFFSILISGNSLAQTSVYHPFPDSNAVWNVEIVSQCSSSTVTWEWYSYVMNGDTSIGGNSYHKIYIPLFLDTSQCFGNSSLAGYYFGCVRQDTSLKRVYFIERLASTENLLYDFSLEVGDTIHGLLTNWGDCADDSVITEIDSILINGNYRKRWKVPTMLMPQHIIEGIGYLGGPFTPICSWEGRDDLSCFTQDNVVLYVDSYNVTHPGLCGIINTIPQIENKQEVKLYPNPFSNEATLETKNFPATLFILNNMGQVVKQQQVNPASTAISCEFLRNGIYTFCIQSSNAEPVYIKALVVK